MSTQDEAGQAGPGHVARGLHWVNAVFMIGLIGIGYYMAGLDLDDAGYGDSLSLHDSLGLIALGVALGNLAWRSRGKPAKAGNGRGARQWPRILRATLLVMTILLPITGYVIASAKGEPIRLFDWFELPGVFPRHRTLCFWAIETHFYLAYATAALLCVHAVAAIRQRLTSRARAARAPSERA